MDSADLVTVVREKWIAVVVDAAVFILSSQQSLFS